MAAGGGGDVLQHGARAPFGSPVHLSVPWGGVRVRVQGVWPVECVATTGCPIARARVHPRGCPVSGRLCLWGPVCSNHTCVGLVPSCCGVPGFRVFCFRSGFRDVIHCIPPPPPLPPLHCHPTTSQQDNQNNQKLFFFAPVDDMACVRRRMDEHTATLGQDCPTVRLSACPPVRLSAYPPAAQCVREMLWAAARGGRTRAAACWLHCRPVLLWLQVSLSEWPAVAKYNQVVSNRPASNDYAKGTPCAAVLPVEYPELTTIHADSTVREYTSRASVTREGMHCGIAYTRCSVSWHCAVTYIHGVARRFARSSCVSVSGSC
jgi:hypothetical protein